MNFIKKIVDKKIDASVHAQFQKFSRGEFRDRAVVEVKKTGKGFNIKTSAEFANELVRIMAEKLGSGRTNVKGAVVSTNDLDAEFDFKEKKQFQGVKRYIIERDMSGDEIVSLLNRFPKTFFALTFDVGEEKLKIKPKAPKSGKPGKENEDGPKADFCALKTNDASIAGSFVFDKVDFKQARFNHTFFVDSITIPDELKSEKDFAIVRERSLRKGRIFRKGEIDGEKIEIEIEFEA